MFHRSMRIPPVCLYALLSLAGPSLRAADDPKEILRRATRMDARNRDLERSYTYVQRDEERTLDSAGNVKHRESKTWDVIPLRGSRYRRLIQRDDRPLSPKQEQQEEAARQRREAARRKTQDLRARETPEQRQKRLDARERARKREQEQMDEVVEGFDLRLVGEEQVDGVPVWVIEGAPRKGYKFQTKETALILSKMKGRIWVSKSDYQPVRIDAETTDTISIGAVLARIYKGTRIHVEYTYVNGEIWLPKRQTFSVSGRIMLLKGLHTEGDSAYSNYKKFAADSRIVDIDQ
ncbi:MAG TPA: hypothetical protein VE959_37310 [Bryobacteraceae bacterium]|nr:hypothetical protein [Bryobacteraceae bacterium]